MGNKLKAISKVSVALALLGAAVPAVEAAPTAMAAKKVKKSTKKAAKKSTKKAKKAKKTTKKVVKKTAAKKSVKKTTKKSVKKVAKKTVVKKPVTKKSVKKSVKKTTTKKPAKKVVKHVTMADKYQPKVKSGTVNIKWGTDLDDSYYGNRPEDFITNKSSLPSDVDFVYLDPVNTEKGGTYKTRIQAKYEDGSKEVVGTVTFVVPMKDADKYQPTVQDVTLNYGDSFSPRNDAITNAPGYFPNDPALSQFEDDSHRTRFYDETDPYLDTHKPGTYNAQIRVEYPDDSYEKTEKFKITVLPSDADKAKVSLKSLNFTVSSNETLEHEINSWPYKTLNDPTLFLNIDSALPEGAVIRFNNSLDSVDTPAPGKYETSLTIYFPDGSEYTTDNFIVNVK